MLARIQQRRDGVATQATFVPLQADSGASGAVQFSGSSTPIGAGEMAKRLHSFLAANAATGVTTERLLETFGDVVGPKDKLVFRHVLRDMAVCRGRRWTLKASDSSADSS